MGVTVACSIYSPWFSRGVSGSHDLLAGTWGGQEVVTLALLARWGHVVPVATGETGWGRQDCGNKKTPTADNSGHIVDDSWIIRR